MTMIERIARAICVADGVGPDAEGCGLGVQMPQGEKYSLWKARERQARATIEAMREPTEEMFKAADDAMLNRLVNTEDERRACWNAGWRAAFNVISKE